MPGQPLPKIIGGPCLMTHRGATLRSKGDVRVGIALRTFPIETSLLGQVDERVSEQPVKLSFVPDGEWSNLSVLWPYANTPFGAFINPQIFFGAIAANQVNVGNTNVFLSGDAFVAQVQGSGTLTTGLVAGQLYYLSIRSATNISVHNSYNDAVAGVNPVAISAGTGKTVGAVNNPLTIQTLNGDLWTFPNVAITKMPSIILSSVKTAVGEVDFTAFLADGQDWSGASSLYTYSTTTPWPGDPTFNPQSILTGEIQAVWGGVTPWSQFDTKDGWVVDFAMSLTPEEVDNVGLIAYKLSNLIVKARAIPVGVNALDVTSAMLLQGAGAARGRSLAASANNLLLSAVAGNLGVKLFNAALEGGGGVGVYSSKLDRVGELSWVATRSFGAAGANPLFAVASATVT